MGDPSLLKLQDADPDYHEDDPTLGLYEDDYSPWAFKEDDSYLAFYIACSDSTSDTNAILQRLINSLTSVGPSTSSTASQLVDRTTRKRITVKLFELESTRNYKAPEPSPDYAELTLEEKLQAAAQRLVTAYGHRILLIVDELDRVRDTSGLASFIKIASSHDLKFLLVGIAQNVSNMLSDHQSIERMAVPVEVPRMNKHELGQIVERAMRKLRDQGITFRFELDAKAELAKVAGGFPWFVHLLGQKALLKAAEEGQGTVSRLHVAIAIRSLIENRLAQQFSDLYQAAVRDSQMRETVMRALAHWIGRDIPTAEVYPVIRRLGVSHPSTYISHLCSETYGRILLRPPFQERGIVRFANEMFKVYVRIRPSLYDGLDNLVKQAHAMEHGNR